MWEWIAIVVGSVLSALLGVAFITMKDRLIVRGGIRIETVEERGPTTREYGFSEKAVKVTIRNASGAKIEIQDIRLMFAKTYGVPLLPKAPPPRSHSQLPATLNSGGAQSWYFPAEKLASHLQSLTSKSIAERGITKLRPRVATSKGKVYKGATFRFSLDINSHWP